MPKPSRSTALEPLARQRAESGTGAASCTTLVEVVLHPAGLCAAAGR